MHTLPKAPDDWNNVAFRTGAYCLVIAVAFVLGVQINAFGFATYVFRINYPLVQTWILVGRLVALCEAALLLLWSYLLLRDSEYSRNLRYGVVGFCLSAITFCVCWFCVAPAPH